MVMYGEEICRKRAPTRLQKRIRLNNQSFSNTFKAGGKNSIGRRISRQMKKTKRTNIEIIDWMLAIDIDPYQIPFLFS